MIKQQEEVRIKKLHKCLEKRRKITSDDKSKKKQPVCDQMYIRLLYVSPVSNNASLRHGSRSVRLWGDLR